jgi:hypothetical protein
MAADLGTDVGGETLAMIPFRIPALGFDDDDAALVADGSSRRLVAAELDIADEGQLRFVRGSADEDRRAFVVLSVMQRSPDARTEVAPLGDGIVCVGNAYDKPMEKHVLVMRPGASVQFRRFGRGGHFGPWHALAWDGQELTVSAALESAS